MRRLRVVVAGWIATVAQTAGICEVLGYIHGLTELGHEVVYVEDVTGIRHWPEDQWALDANQRGRRILEDALSTCEERVPYCYHVSSRLPDGERIDRWFGMDERQLVRVMGTADVLICVGALTSTSSLPRPRRTLVIDSDPVWTQLRMLYEPDFVDYYKQYDAVATVGALIGSPGCDVPTHGFAWIPTRMPVSTRQWPVANVDGRKKFTTLSSWSSQFGHYPYEGRVYRISKDREWIKVIDLPRSVPWEMEIAIATNDSSPDGMPYTVQSMFRDHGWKLASPTGPSNSIAGYKRFIAQATGEFTIAKIHVVDLPSGWFSERSAIFLASGRPVVTGETGFSTLLPTGEGLFAFADVDEAASALREIDRDYRRHARAARQIAETYFEATSVLQNLLDRVM